MTAFVPRETRRTPCRAMPTRLARTTPATPPVGKNQFKLIGVSEFNLPQHKGHTVIVKGLNIEATPVGRPNITSVTTIAPSCAVPK